MIVIHIFCIARPLLYFDDYIFSIHSVKVRILVPNLIIKIQLRIFLTPTQIQLNIKYAQFSFNVIV